MWRAFLRFVSVENVFQKVLVTKQAPGETWALERGYYLTFKATVAGPYCFSLLKKYTKFDENEPFFRVVWVVENR